LSVRAMLGANRAQIAGGAISEVLVLTTVAIAGAAASAGRIVGLIRASLPEGIGRWIAGWSSLRVDAVGVIAGAAVCAAVAMAIASVVGMTGLTAARKHSAGARVTRRSTWGRRVLVASEVTLAAALLLGASVVTSGFARISAAFEALAPSRVLRF